MSTNLKLHVSGNNVKGIVVFLSGVVSVRPICKHLGNYTLNEILFGKVVHLNLGRWEKAALFEDM